MKFFLVLVFILLTNIALFSLGNFEVDSFIEVEKNDSLNVSRLEIICKLEGLRFAFGSRKIKSDWDSLSYTYKIDLKRNQTFLTIKRTDYEDFRLNIIKDYKFRVSKDKNYQLKLINIPPPPPVEINFFVKTDSVDFYIDEVKKNIAEPQLLGIGKHKIRIEKNLYKSINKEIKITEDDTKFSFKMKKLKKIKLEIDTKPRKSIVTIDSVVYGPSPVYVSLYPGKYSIHIFKEGYGAIEEELIVEGSKFLIKTYKLSKDVANLLIKSAPQKKMMIYFNNESMNLETPHKFRKMKPGKYSIQGISDVYETNIQEIDLKAGDNLEIILASRKIVGDITIISEPEAGCRIFQDGEKTPYETPYTIFDLPIGKYSFHVKNDFFYSDTLETEITAIQKEDLTFVCQPTFSTININTFKKAKVKINNKYVDSNKNIRLKCDLAEIKIEMSGAEPIFFSQELITGKTYDLDLYPEIPSGTISFTSNIENVKIQLIGNEESYIGNEKTRFSRVPIGKYKMKISKRGFESFRDTIYVTDKIESKINIDLKERTNKLDGFVFVEYSKKNHSNNNLDFEETTQDFYIATNEVTQKEWLLLFDENNSFFKGDSLPVESISWYEAIEYCNKKSLSENLLPCYNINQHLIEFIPENNGYRLPTVEEWTIASSGGDISENYIYSGSDSLNTVGWFSINSENKTHPVKQKLSNELGIYDMSGNVSEWCFDNEHEETTKKAVRGGNWKYGEILCRPKSISSEIPYQKRKYIGLRLAKSL